MKENSIEEDIEILGAFNLAPSLKHISEDEFKDVQKAIKHILSDYKKVQEEFKAVDSECSRLEHKEVELERIIELMSEHIFFNQSDKFPIAYSINDVKDYFINIAKEVK